MTGTTRSRGLLAVPLALGVAGGWAQAVSTDEKESDMKPIEVTVTWSEQIPLPPEAQLVVTIADVARAGAPATVLVETTIERPPPPPIRVGLPIEEQALDPRARYAARARVLVGGELLMTSDTIHPVLRTPGDRAVEVVLRAVPAVGTRPGGLTAAALANTYWRLKRLGDDALVTGEGRREPSLILNEVDGRRSWSATIGCNRLNGQFESSGSSIRFLPGASTRMACPAPLAQRERALLDVLGRVAAWRIEGERLSLLDTTGDTLLVAEAVHLD